MGTKRNVGVWVTCVIVWPILMWMVYAEFGFNVDGRGFDYALFLLLTIVISLFPIHVRGTDIFFMQGVSLAAFLQFGLFAEVVLTQISTIAFLLYLRVGRTNNERYPMNMLMFFTVSLISGFVFYGVGGQIDSEMTSFSDYLPVIAYVITMFLSNHMLLFTIRRFLVRKPSSFLGRDVGWEAVTTGLMLPIGLVLYLLYIQVGTAAIIFVGIPFASLSAVLRLYHSSERINDLLQQTNDIGRELSEKLTVSDMLEFFTAELTAMFSVDYAYILDEDPDGRDGLNLIRLFERENDTLPGQVKLTKSEGISGHIWLTGEAVRYGHRRQWQRLSKRVLPDKVQSVMTAPMRRNQKTTGIITLASFQKRSYERHHLMIFEILANFLAVAIENARNYEDTKNQSERDPLTGLYNYRYFTNLLEAIFQNSDIGSSPLSLILIDIDHFKNINDTYGHEAGNEVLVGLSNRLTSLTDDQGTVARYGGEEFVIVLPDKDEDKCLAIAENVRGAISDKSFLSTQYHAGETFEQQIHVTASIGIATAPEQGEDPLSLIRNADRAMYAGAKQKGKNRVSAYIG